MANQVFIVDDLVFASPNAIKLPNTHSSSHWSGEFNTDYFDPQDMFKPLWSIDACPWMAFIPAPPAFTHPVFSTLNHTYRSLPIEPKGGLWGLSAELISEWDHVERSLANLHIIFQKELPGKLFSLDYRSARLPCSYGYRKLHRDEARARRCALRSRDAFAVFMGMCCYFMALHCPEGHLRDKTPSWVKALDKYKVPAAWGDMLKASFLGDWRSRRVGVIVHMSKREWVDELPTMISHGVPIWMYWGTVQHPLSVDNAVPKHYRPHADQVKFALEMSLLRSHS